MPVRILFKKLRNLMLACLLEYSEILYGGYMSDVKPWIRIFGAKKLFFKT